jgi:hypothetical protein
MFHWKEAIRRLRSVRAQAAPPDAAVIPPAPEAPPGSVLQDRRPVSEVLERAIVTPGRHRPERIYSGEAFRSDGQLCALSLRHSSRYRHVPIPPRLPVAERLAGHHLFAGPLFRIFGHDLVELPGRLWPLLEGKFDGIVVTKWRPGDDAFQLKVEHTISTILAAFGIGPGDIRIIERPTEIERLTVPEHALYINNFGLPILGDCFRRIAGHYRTERGFAGRGFYLSRTKARFSRVANEPEIEAAARAAGLQVLHPQMCALSMQIALMGQAEVIAGTDGSALHLAAFARPGTRLVYFDTRDLTTQRIINAAAALDAHSISVPLGRRVEDPRGCFRRFLS